MHIKRTSTVFKKKFLYFYIVPITFGPPIPSYHETECKFLCSNILFFIVAKRITKFFEKSLTQKESFEMYCGGNIISRMISFSMSKEQTITVNSSIKCSYPVFSIQFIITESSRIYKRKLCLTEFSFSRQDISQYLMIL